MASNNKKYLYLILCLLTFLGLTSFQSANAEIEIKSHKAPVILVLENDISMEKSHVGDSVNFHPSDTLVYDNQIIPGTSKFIGKITEIKKSKRFGKNGFIKLEMNRFCISDSNCVNIEENNKKIPYIKLYDKKIQVSKIYENSILDPAIFVGGIAVDFILPGVGSAIDGIYDVHDEFKKDPERKKSIIKKVGSGLWETTMIPSVIRFFRVRPNPKYQSGQHILIRFNPDFLGKVFIYCKVHRLYVEKNLD